MYPISPEFQTAIEANARRVDAIVTINYTDLLADESASGSSADENRVSQVEQVADGKTSNSYLWLAADGNNILDGSYHPCPDDAVADFNQIGWWSQTLSDGSGNFSPGVVVNATFASRIVTGLDISGDDQRGEYPVDFTVDLYNGVSLEYTETVTGNTEVFFQTTIAEQTGIDKLTLTITKWSHPNRVAKIAELSSSVVKTYNGSTIINFTVAEQREITNNNSIPTGNIAASSLDLVLANADRQFDANNTASNIYGLVKPNNKVYVEIGVRATAGFEYIPFFTGWTGGWIVPENSIEASVQALDILDFLGQSNYSTSTVQTDLTFYDWFELVLNDGGFDSNYYNIDSTLLGSDYIVPYGWFDDISHREALNILSTACSASVYQDREGIIQVEAVDFLDSNYLVSEQTFDRSDYMDKSNHPVYENVSNRVTVTTQPIVKTTSVLIYETSDDEQETIAASSTEDYTIFYNDSPVDDQVASISPAVTGLSIIDTSHYSWGSVITVQNTNGTEQSFKFSVTGSTFDVKGKQTVIRSNTESINNNGLRNFNFNENQFLQKKVLAEKIAESLIGSFSDPERDLSIQFEPGGNPALEMGDRITVTDLYQSKEYNIVNSVVRFDGGMSQQLQGRVTG